MHELRTAAKQLNRAKQYAEAADIYRELYAEKQDITDGTELVFCNLQLKRYVEALELCRQLYARSPEQKNIRVFYAQSIYYTQIKTDKPDKDTYMRAAQGLTKLVSPADPYGFFIPTVLKTLAFLKEHRPDDAALRLEWANKVLPENLSSKPFEIQGKKDDKHISLPSQLETWALHKANALAACKHHSALCEFATSILNRPDMQQSRYRVWLVRLLAQAHLHTGNPAEALNLYEKIIEQKKDWFLYHEYARLHARNAQADQALHLLTHIRLMQIPPYGAVSVALTSADLLKTKGELAQSQGITALARQIAQRNSLELGKTAQNAFAEISDDTPIYMWDNFCKQHRKKHEPAHTGRFLFWLPGEKAGFIRTEQGEKLYFSASDFDGQTAQLNPDTALKFDIADAYDKKKQQKSKKAVNIKLM